MFVGLSSGMWSLFEGIVCLHYAYHFCPTETGMRMRA